MALTCTNSPLHPYGSIEIADLGRGQPPGSGRAQRSEADWPDLSPDQPTHRVTGLREHSPHYVLAALVHSEFDKHPRSGSIHDTEPIGDYSTVFEFDSGRQPTTKILGYRPRHLGQICLKHPVSRVREPMRELAVVCEQNQALGIEVEPAHVEQALAPIGDQVSDGTPAPVIRHRAHDAGRLVQREIHQVGACRYPLAIDPDDLPLRINPRAEPANDLAIDLYPAGADELLAASPAPNARCGKDFLQPDAIGHVDETVALAGFETPVVIVFVVVPWPTRLAWPVSLTHDWAPHQARHQADLAGMAQAREGDPGSPGQAVQGNRT